MFYVKTEIEKKILKEKLIHNIYIFFFAEKRFNNIISTNLGPQKMPKFRSEITTIYKL